MGMGSPSRSLEREVRAISRAARPPPRPRRRARRSRPCGRRAGVRVLRLHPVVLLHGRRQGLVVMWASNGRGGWTPAKYSLVTIDEGPRGRHDERAGERGPGRRSRRAGGGRVRAAGHSRQILSADRVRPAASGIGRGRDRGLRGDHGAGLLHRASASASARCRAWPWRRPAVPGRVHPRRPRRHHRGGSADARGHGRLPRAPGRSSPRSTDAEARPREEPRSEAAEAIVGRVARGPGVIGDGAERYRAEILSRRRTRSSRGRASTSRRARPPRRSPAGRGRGDGAGGAAALYLRRGDIRPGGP
jgi:hypothetical protein